MCLLLVFVQHSLTFRPALLRDKDGDVKILKDLAAFFNVVMRSETRSEFLNQFAVLYYGDRDVRATLSPDVIERCRDQLERLTDNRNIFITSPILDSQYDPNYDVDQCPFIASRIQKDRDEPGPPQGRHTENNIIDSLSTCPSGVGNSNDAKVYLYSYLRPCNNGEKACSKAIVDFSDECSANFSALVVGYKNDLTYNNRHFIDRSRRAVEIDIGGARRQRPRYLYRFF